MFENLRAGNFQKWKGAESRLVGEGEHGDLSEEGSSTRDLGQVHPGKQ